MANFGDTFSYALIVTLFGMGIVFIVLVALQYILKAMKLLNREKKEVPKAVIESRETAVNQALTPEISEIDAQEDEELVAVITAAVIACLGGNSSIVVRDIRRVEDNTPVWGRVSRTEQMAGRF